MSYELYSYPFSGQVPLDLLQLVGWGGGGGGGGIYRCRGSRRIGFGGGVSWCTRRCVVCFCASLNRGLTVLSNGLASIVFVIHPPTSFTAETSSSCLPWLSSSSPPYVIFYSLEPSKLEGCWSEHPRRAKADWKLVVERQYRWSVSRNVIA